MTKRTAATLVSAFFFVLLTVCPCPAVETAGGRGTEDYMIHRDKDSKSVTFTIRHNGSWALFEGRSPGRIDYARPVLNGENPGVYPVRADAGSRLYFAVEQEGRRTILAERHLPMSGGYNFRDLGGIRTTDGREVAWGRLFRSDGLNRLTREDLEYLASIPLITVTDFRNQHEAEKSPDKLPPSVKHHLHYAITPGRLDAGNAEAIFAKPAGDEFMEDMNRSLVRDKEIQDQYREFFRRVQDRDFLPLLFHCSAGKDRTGLAAALILFSLGVDKAAIMRDYMDSEHYLAGKYEHLMAKYPDHAVLFMVKPQFLEAAIQAMEEDYGSVERYLVEVLGVEPSRMRDLFLQ